MHASCHLIIPRKKCSHFPEYVEFDKFHIAVFHRRAERAKNVVSNNLGLVDFAVEVVDSILHLPNEQVKFFDINFEKI